MLVTADWVLPISRRPLRDGAVLIEDGHIIEVGTLAELDGHPAAGERRHFAGCAIMPGLVNAHTHLTLTALDGVLEPAPFDVWLPRLVRAMSAWTDEDHAISAAYGAQKCIRAGVTVVGDIVYSHADFSAAEKCGLGGVYYWEVLGVPGEQLFSELERTGFPAPQVQTARARFGLSPHAPYSSGPGLLKATHELANELGVPVAIHVAESDAEVELLEQGTGSLASTAARLAHDFVAPGIGPVAYLDRLGVLDGTTTIHLSQITPSDIARLLAASRGAVTCPRSNRYLHTGSPDVRRMLERGVPVGVGTDSLASNHDLDLMSEIRILRDADRRIPAPKLLEMATAMGAIALGVEDRYGILECGMQADLAIFRIAETREPEAALVDTAGAASLQAVMAGGEWKLLEGEPLCDSLPCVDDVTASRERALAALQG